MNKIIIVGASSGIGKELACLYADTDAKIGLIGRREENLKKLSLSNPDKFIYKACDVSNTDLSAICMKELVDELGGLDVVVISAGTGELNSALDYSLEESTILTNVLGWTHLMDWAYLYFQNQRHGHLVNISSVGGIRGDGISPAYNASKSYQINYTEGIRKKVAKLQLPIFITDVRPGFVDTSMAKGDGLFWVASVEEASEQIFRAIQQRSKIVYVTRRWQLIAVVLKWMPTWLYCKI